MSGFAPPNTWTPHTLPRLRRSLLAWFDRHQRSLPWRATRDPYPIWVSEVMLQQTTVAAVVPFFTRFLTAFPTVGHLAQADEQAVLHLWQGLGYYRRARHLHAAARQLVADHGGQLPDDPEVWAALPGVGRYILGAVLSQAFERRLPIVEANTLRVLSRWFGYRGNPRDGVGKAGVWQAAERVLPRKRVGDFNQAMMELGALVCTPTAPQCDSCPVARWCEAKRTGTAEQIPPPVERRPQVAVREVAVIIQQDSRVFLVQRPSTAARWANLWEVPHGELQSGESDEAAAVRLTHDLTGFTIRPGSEVATITHGVTRWTITMVGLEATRIRGRFHSSFYQAGEWVEVPQLTGYPLSTPQRQLLDHVARPGRQLRLC